MVDTPDHVETGRRQRGRGLHAHLHAMLALQSIINPLLRNLTALDRVNQGLDGTHLLVDRVITQQDRITPCANSGHRGFTGRMCTGHRLHPEVVAEHHTVELQRPFQQPVDDCRGKRRHVVFVECWREDVRCHEAHHTRTNGLHERHKLHSLHPPPIVFDDGQAFVGVDVRVPMPRKVLTAGGNTTALKRVDQHRAEFGDHVGPVRQRAIADHRIGRVGMDVENRREVERDARGTQFRGERPGETRDQIATTAAPQRDGRGPLGERRPQARHTAALLIDADPQRPLALQARHLPREFRQLMGGMDVAREVDHAAEVEGRNQPAEVVRRRVSLEPDNRQSSGLAPEIAERHARDHYNAPVRIDSSAPTRIDLAGGTYDIWPLYLFHDKAQTLNAAISLRARCSLTSRRDYRIRLVSEDTGEEVEAADPQALPVDRLPLLTRLVKHFGARGLEIRTRAESPVGAGIAGSSAMNIALIGALAAWTGRPMSDEEVLTTAMNIEAQVIHVPTGVQDYRPAFYGGVSAIELGVGGVRRVQLDVDPAELQRRLVLAYTGASRNSGINNWDVMVRRINGDAAVTHAFEAIGQAAASMRDALEAGDWTAVGMLMAAEWHARKRLAPGVTTPEIDQLLDRARFAGALAGKVCGAGGGGCLVCIVDPARKAEVETTLSAGGARVLRFAVETHGLIVERH
jgi:D-glycero-alpha-D-manno-heptose-7-phosphate kinase